MNLLTLLVSALVDYRQQAREAVHCLRSRHAMREMSDGPVCGICGHSWLWTDRPQFWDSF